MIARKQKATEFFFFCFHIIFQKSFEEANLSSTNAFQQQNMEIGSPMVQRLKKKWLSKIFESFGFVFFYICNHPRKKKIAIHNNFKRKLERE